MIDARGNSRKRISIIWASCLGYVCAVWFSPVWHVVKSSRPWLCSGSSKQKKMAHVNAPNERVHCNPSQKESWMDLRNKNCYALSDVTLFLLVNLFRMLCTSLLIIVGNCFLEEEISWKLTQSFSTSWILMGKSWNRNIFLALEHISSPSPPVPCDVHTLSH